MGALAQFVHDRILGFPIERPKSLSVRRPLPSLPRVVSAGLLPPVLDTNHVQC